MAWGIRGVGTVATVASGNLTLTEPAGCAQGDLLIAFIAIRSTVGFANADWTLVESELTGDSDATNGIASCQMWACRRGASAPSLVFTRTGGDVGHGAIVAYTGAKGTTYADCFDVSASITLASASSIASCSNLTNTEADVLIVAMVALGDTGAPTNFDASVDPSGNSGAVDTTTAPVTGTWTLRVSAGTGTGADTGLGIGDAVRSGFGSTTGSITAGAAGITARHAGCSAAFKMAVAGPQPPIGGAIQVRQSVTRAATY
jgi:hypothetical protein